MFFHETPHPHNDFLNLPALLSLLFPVLSIFPAVQAFAFSAWRPVRADNTGGAWLDLFYFRFWSRVFLAINSARACPSIAWPFD